MYGVVVFLFLLFLLFHENDDDETFTPDMFSRCAHELSFAQKLVDLVLRR